MFTEKIKKKFNKTFVKIVGETWNDINYISKNKIISSINSTISKLDLVTREEFEIQVQVLQKACQEIDDLKLRIKKCINLSLKLYSQSHVVSSAFSIALKIKFKEYINFNKL